MATRPNLDRGTAGGCEKVLIKGKCLTAYPLSPLENEGFREKQADDCLRIFTRLQEFWELSVIRLHPSRHTRGRWNADDGSKSQPPGRSDQSFSRVSLLMGGTVVPRGTACFSGI